MSLKINSFGSRLSFELVRDDDTVGGLAYVKTGSALAARGSARANVHGEEIIIQVEPNKAKNGMVCFDIYKEKREFGELDFNWRGKGKLELKRRQGGEDKFNILPKGLSDLWFLITDRANVPVMEVRPITQWNAAKYQFEVHTKTERFPERVIDGF